MHFGYYMRGKRGGESRQPNGHRILGQKERRKRKGDPIVPHAALSPCGTSPRFEKGVAICHTTLKNEFKYKNRSKSSLVTNFLLFLVNLEICANVNNSLNFEKSG